MNRILSLATGAGVLLLAGTAAQAQSYGYAHITVCNHTRHVVYVAMQTPTSPYSAQGRVQGWWTIYAQQCLGIGTFPAGQVDFFANSADWSLVWDGLNSPQSVRTCLRFPGRFDRINHPGYTCSRDEQLKSMASRQVPDGRYTLDLN